MLALKNSLTVRLAGYFLVLSLFTVSVVGALAFVQARGELEQQVVGQLSLVSEAKGDEIGRWVDQQREFVEFLVRAPELRSNAQLLVGDERPGRAESAYRSISAYLGGTIATKPDIEEIMLIDDRDGRVVLSTSSEHEGSMVNEASFFLLGRQRAALQPTYRSSLTDRPTLTIAAPLTDQGGRRRAVLAVNLSLGRLGMLLARSGLGTSSEAYAVMADGSLVAGDRARRPLRLSTPGIDAARDGRQGVELYENADAVPVIGAYRWLEGPQLALLVEMHQREAFAPAQRLATTIVLVGAALTGLLALGAWLLARQIARPLVQLTRSAAQVASGNLSGTVPVGRDDETGVLARAFNQMTERLRVVYGELQRSEEHFRSLIEHASDAILIVGRDGIIRYDGPSISEVLGYEHKFLRGQRLNAFVHSHEIDGLLEAVERCYDAADETLAVEFRFRDAWGKWRVLEGRGQRLIDIAGQPGIVINARDISERKRAEEERARLQEESLRLRSEFISTVSHELRTPLTPIRGYVDMLLMGAAGRLGPEQESFVQIVKSNTLRMEGLVDDLLDIGRIQAGKIVLNYSRIDLARLLDSELRLFQSEVERKRLFVSVDIADDLPALSADPRRISQVVVNLLSNAIKYTREQGNIWVRAFAQGDGQLVIQVADSGIGLNEEQQAKLFTPFYRADNGLRSEVGGTGLGLCIVKSFVELHGGSIGVESAPGKGSVFSVTLPLGRQNGHAPASTVQEQELIAAIRVNGQGVE